MSLVNETTTAVLNSLATTSQDQIVNLTATSAASSVAETVTSSTVHFIGELSTTFIVNHQSTVASSLVGHATDAISTAVSRGKFSSTKIAFYFAASVIGLP
jgi:acetylglutamate kinase